MDDRAWIATRKGLFELRRRADAWAVERVGFLGEPAPAVLPPRADGRMLAAPNLGHFGVTLHASDDAGAHWREVATPAYPAQPEGAAGPPWRLVQCWTLEASGDAVRAGTLPGGLCRCDDLGSAWRRVEPLWHVPGRSGWFGGGCDVPGIHSICPHRGRADELRVGISCAGCRWAAPAAACGRARTAACAGAPCRRTCRRSARCVSAEGRAVPPDRGESPFSGSARAARRKNNRRCRCRGTRAPSLPCAAGEPSCRRPSTSERGRCS